MLLYSTVQTRVSFNIDPCANLSVARCISIFLSLPLYPFLFAQKNQKVYFESCGQILSLARFYDLIEGRASTNEITVMRDVVDKKTVNKVQDIHFDAVFSEYIKNEKILDVVECFTGPNILAIHTMLIAKPPDSGFGTSK